ncbi:DNA mismatch repair protein [Clostridia bacterium]|nr:DNA mismatch repair protein [Clostridia bacterium]
MMSRINVLDKHVAELIAAGEVVERPSSVIKELIENSIDAGASAITVEIKNGGIKYMRIADDGCGIVKEDVPKAFLRHATSKVMIEEDLDSIATLGFRGEALASVCAVAKVEMLTCAVEEETGTRYTINGGEEAELSDAGCPKGTTILVRDLFYNIPARMKFLKKDVSESNAVAGVVDKIALSHPEIAITFIRDGKRTLQTSGDGSLKSAIYSVYGREFASGLIEVDYSLNCVAVKGFLSKPQHSRANRNMQNFFINGRFVKSRTAAAAVEEACKGSVMIGKFPACVLHIGISNAAVDVNVHPAKIEVRFINERPIFDAVYHAVKSALLKGDTVKEVALKPADIFSIKQQSPFTVTKNPYELKPEPPIQLTVKPITKTEDYPQQKNQNNAIDETEIFIPKTTKFTYNTNVADSNNNISDAPKTQLKEVFRIDSVDFFEEELKKEARPEEKSQVQINKEVQKTAVLDDVFSNDTNEIKFIGEAFKTYIIMQSGSKLLLVDKHAAHERIIYEKLKKEKGSGSMQYLIAPVTVTLTKQEYDAVLNSKKLLLDTGFEIDDFGSGTVVVRGVPQYLEHGDIPFTIEEIAGYLLEHKTDINTTQTDWIYHSISCRAAIKAGDISHSSELIELVKKIEEDETLRYCPHGRPVQIAITKHEIEKQFGRV